MASKSDLIEQEFGRPLPEVLEDLFQEHGSQVAVAKALGVTQGTVSLWLVRYGFSQKTVLVKED